LPVWVRDDALRGCSCCRWPGQGTLKTVSSGISFISIIINFLSLASYSSIYLNRLNIAGRLTAFGEPSAAAGDLHSLMLACYMYQETLEIPHTMLIFIRVAALTSSYIWV